MADKPLLCEELGRGLFHRLAYEAWRDALLYGEPISGEIDVPPEPLGVSPVEHLLRQMRANP